jgi:predicted Abi (CAAX) family protease
MIRELNEMAERFRTGDGDGRALVSSAHSCVQDSNQALGASLEETHQRSNDNPKIQG